MRRQIQKIIIGRGHSAGEERRSSIRGRWENVQAIWNNTYEEDAGLEKIVRLLLAMSQFLYPGLYIRQLFWRKGQLIQDFAIEVYVLLKATFPLLVLYLGWEQHSVAYFIVVWLMLETLMYIPTLIFASDTFSSPRSFRRSKILLFLNYWEVALGFAVMHAAGQYMNLPFTHWFDPVYVSFVITSTIGFGEYYPITPFGKLVIVLQSLFYLSYIVLFISIFNMGGVKGYFKDVGGK
jgi:hypothetical protein